MLTMASAGVRLRPTRSCNASCPYVLFARFVDHQGEIRRHVGSHCTRDKHSLTLLAPRPFLRFVSRPQWGSLKTFTELLDTSVLGTIFLRQFWYTTRTPKQSSSTGWKLLSSLWWKTGSATSVASTFQLPLHHYTNMTRQLKCQFASSFAYQLR